MRTHPDSQLSNNHDELRSRLTLLADNPELDGGQRELARSWRSRIDTARAAASAPLSIAFLAAAGRGKSSLIAAASGLRLDQPGNPKKWSVLPVGDGRTTLGELRVVFDELGKILLEVEPMPADELAVELGIFARDRFDAVSGATGHVDSMERAGEELHALFRAWLVPTEDDAWELLDQQARACKDAATLEHEWSSRIDLEQRTRPLECEFAWDTAGQQLLRDVLASLMNGTLPQGPVPRVTRVRIPRPEFAGLIDTLIDTQGIDSDGTAGINGRTDFLDLLSDPDVLLVICSDFKEAPDPISIGLLESIQQRVGGQGMRERAVRLLIVDNRDEDGEQDAKRDRAKKSRIAQCRDKLRRKQIDLRDDRVIAIDVRRDTGVLRSALSAMALEAREIRVESWRQALQDADNATSSLRDLGFAAKVRALDLQLWWAWDAELARVPPRKVDGLAVLSNYLPEGDYHSARVYAAVRRRGRYPKLDLVNLGATCATGTSIGRYELALAKVKETAARLSDGSDGATTRHLSLRVRSFGAAVAEYRREVYQEWWALFSGYFKSHRATSMWKSCSDRWGSGESGYVRAVATRIGEEAEQAGLVVGPLAPLERNLPARPELFRVRKVSLRNFRGIDEQIAVFAPTTVIIGDNGLGKTCWLEAIAVAVGTFLPGVGAGPAPKLENDDIRAVIRMLGDIPDRQPQLPMVIEVEAVIEGHPLTWNRSINTLPVGEATSSDDALQLEARRAGEEVRAHSNRQLPVLAYYGTQRLWPSELEAKNELGGNRLDGYRDCLTAASTHQHMLNWMRKYTFAQLQNKKPVVQLQAIEQAVLACIDGAAAFRYQIDSEQLMLTMSDGQCFSFSMLSDGYRNMVAMVADIAWRASVLNPQLRERAPQLAEGVVLIDEIDLHLHPNWQRRVLGDLRRAFPRLQFIATTHSPFIVQSLDPGQLFNLDPDAQEAPYANESPEDIAERHMGVDLPQRSDRRRREYEVAKRYYELLDALPTADPVKLAKLKAELDDILAPYADNQAFVAFLERKRYMQESRRS